MFGFFRRKKQQHKEAAQEPQEQPEIQPAAPQAEAEVEEAQQYRVPPLPLKPPAYTYRSDWQDAQSVYSAPETPKRTSPPESPTRRRRGEPDTFTVDRGRVTMDQRSGDLSIRMGPSGKVRVQTRAGRDVTIHADGRYESHSDDDCQHHQCRRCRSKGYCTAGSFEYPYVPGTPGAAAVEVHLTTYPCYDPNCRGGGYCSHWSSAPVMPPGHATYCTSGAAAGQYCVVAGTTPVVQPPAQTTHPYLVTRGVPLMVGTVPVVIPQQPGGAVTHYVTTAPQQLKRLGC